MKKQAFFVVTTFLSPQAGLLLDDDGNYPGVASDTSLHGPPSVPQNITVTGARAKAAATSAKRKSAKGKRAAGRLVAVDVMLLQGQTTGLEGLICLIKSLLAYSASFLST